MGPCSDLTSCGVASALAMPIIERAYLCPDPCACLLLQMRIAVRVGILPWSGWRCFYDAPEPVTGFGRPPRRPLPCVLQAMAHQLAGVQSELESAQRNNATLAAENAALKVRSGYHGTVTSTEGSARAGDSTCQVTQQFVPLQPCEVLSFCLQAAEADRDAAVLEAAAHRAAATVAQGQLSQALAKEHAAQKAAKV